MAKLITDMTREEIEERVAKQVLDPEEQEIEDALARGEYEEVDDLPERLEEMRQAAADILRKKPITMRMNKLMLDQLKLKASEQGLPYQSFVNSILHKYLNGKLVERD
jgi:predicted DNA binding CopG/RHH family protein